MRNFFYLLAILLIGFLLTAWLRDKFSSARRGESALRQENNATALSEFKPLADYAQADLTGFLPEWKEAIGTAKTLYSKGRFAEAKNATEEALLIARNEGGENHLAVATSLDSLGRISRAMGDHASAERHYESALHLMETNFGLDHMLLAPFLHNFAGFYAARGKFDKSDLLYARALAIMEEEQGGDDSGDAWTGKILLGLAKLRYQTDRFDEAENLVGRSLSEYRMSSGDTTVSEARALNLLAGIYCVNGSPAQAILLAQHSAEILERELGSKHSNVQTIERNLDSLKEMKCDEESDYLLILTYAAFEGHEEIVRILLDKGVDVNSIVTEDGETALILASWYGRNKTVGLLLAAGADPNVSGKKGMEGLTALVGTSMNGHANAAAALLGSGANPNKPFHAGNTALMVAAVRGDRDMAELLLRHGADIEAANDFGRTPLTTAAARGHYDVVKLLLDAGADPLWKDQDGRTALGWAENNGHAETAALISDFETSLRD